MIPLDCETSTDIAQNLRVCLLSGQWVERGTAQKALSQASASPNPQEELAVLMREATDRLEEQGFIIGDISPDEIAIVNAYAANIGARVLQGGVRQKVLLLGLQEAGARCRA